MEEKFYVYKYYIQEELLYVGRTNDFIRRFKQHLRENSKYNEITRIDIATFLSDGDMMLYEKYYITKFHPPLNQVDMQFSAPTFCLPEPVWETYTREEFNKLINNNDNYNSNTIENKKEKNITKSISYPIITNSIEISTNIHLSWFKQFDMNFQIFIFNKKYIIEFDLRYDSSSAKEKKTLYHWDKNYIINYWCDLLDKKINKIPCKKENPYDVPWMGLIIKLGKDIISAHSMSWIEIRLDEKKENFIFGEHYKNAIIDEDGIFHIEEIIKEWEELCE